MSSTRSRRRALAIFGGTFDPIHCGHMVVAEAAMRRFRLDAVYFVPSARPPHKNRQELAPFCHRYAIVALACAGKRGFVPSLAEAPCGSAQQIFYSIDTVSRFRRQHPREKTYFILGADSFLDIAKWKSAEALLDSCDFIIANRPGVRVDTLRAAVPQQMLPSDSSDSPKSIALRKSNAYILTTVASEISSTDIRRRCTRGLSIRGLVPTAVEDYIRTQALYR